MSDPLWLTYAWVDNDEGDFDYLVQKLEKAGVPTRYDKISLVPGRRLWTQIANRISFDHCLAGPPLSHGIVWLAQPVKRN